MPRPSLLELSIEEPGSIYRCLKIVPTGSPECLVAGFCVICRLASSFRSSVMFVDFSQPSLWHAAAFICFNPFFWNLAARTEYGSHLITSVVGRGNAYHGCYALAVTIFLLGICRDHVFKSAILQQPSSTLLSDSALVQAAAAVSFSVGSILVITSIWTLGITGTYLGDYFGILMKVRGN